MTTRPAPDSRVDRIAWLFWLKLQDYMPGLVAEDWEQITERMRPEILAEIEPTGLVLLDPDDEATMKRIRFAISDPGTFIPRVWKFGMYEDEPESLQQWQARAVLRALAAPGGAG